MEKKIKKKKNQPKCINWNKNVFKEPKWKKIYQIVLGNVKNGIHMELKYIRIILKMKKMQLLMWMVLYHLLKIDGDKRQNIFKYVKCYEYALRL